MQKYGVTLNSQNELEMPADLPAKLKKLLQSDEVIAALRYKEIQFEYDHRKHLDVISQKLRSLKQKQFQKLKEDQINEKGKKS